MILIFVSIFLSMSTLAKPGVDFSRHILCARENFQCGQCEDVALQNTESLLEGFVGSNASLTDVLENLVHHAERSLSQKFVPILLGTSPSLMTADSDHPKVILKSPESELIIAYNTDPKSDAFPTIEVMRFDGRDGRFKMELISHNREGKIQVELNPAACVRCHGSDPKPLWDTYRAWPGMWAGRDDLIERKSVTTAPYIQLLKKIEKIHETGTTNEFERRLALIHPTVTSAEIEAQIQKSNWVRIPHRPLVEALKNKSLRTARYAGPGHVMFDQLSANMGCVIQRRLKDVFSTAQFQNFIDHLSLPKQKIVSSENFQSWFKLQQSEQMDHRLKMDRQHDWLISLGATRDEAIFESSKLKVSFKKKWFAIADPGGVRGVPEADLSVLAWVEDEIQPFGLHLSDFSMSVGPIVSPGFSSFSFSDQFLKSVMSVR
jgi:hypothetical protein